MSKYCVLIVYDTEGWAYHHNARSLKKYAPADFEVVISTAYKELLKERSFDLVLFQPFSHVAGLRTYCREIGVTPLIVPRFSVGWGYANEWLENLRPNADGVIITSYRMWDKAGRLDGTWYLPSGVNDEVFNITNPVEQRKQKLLWSGSEFHRKVKGYDDILVPLRDRLAALGLELDLRLIDSNREAKYTPSEMAEWYNSGTIYLCASLAEGTPNTCLEAAACGCTLITTPVGSMPELIRHGWNGYLVKWDVDAFLQCVTEAVTRYTSLARNMQTIIGEWSWRRKAEGYFNLFRQLIGGPRPVPKT